MANKALLIVTSGPLMAKAVVNLTEKTCVSATKCTLENGEAGIFEAATQFVKNNASAEELILVFGNRSVAIKGQGILKYYRNREDVDTAVAAMTQSEYITDDVIEAVENFANAVYDARNARQKIQVRKASTLKKWEIVPDELADKTVKTITFKNGVSEDSCWHCFENSSLTGTFKVMESRGKFSVPRMYTGTDKDGNEVTLEAYQAIQRYDIDWDIADHLPMDLLEAYVNFLPKLTATRTQLTAAN